VLTNQERLLRAIGDLTDLHNNLSDAEFDQLAASMPDYNENIRWFARTLVAKTRRYMVALAEGEDIDDDE
jgi:hypothetical protein